MNEKKQCAADYALGFAAGALYTRTEQAINTVVAEAGGALSGHELAFRLGELLLSKASGEVLRAADSVLAVRRTATKRRKTVEPLAVARRPRGHSAPVVKAKKQRKHWTQLPENKKRVEAWTKKMRNLKKAA